MEPVYEATTTLMVQEQAPLPRLCSLIPSVLYREMPRRTM